MNIHLHSPTQLRVTFRYNPRIVERIKRLPARQYTFDKRAKCWYVSLDALQELPELFPKASYDWPVFGALADLEQFAAERFYRWLRREGVRFTVTSTGIVRAHGEGVSPCLQWEVFRRSKALQQFVAREPGDGKTRTPAEVLDEATSLERALVDGIANAAQREEQQRHMKRGRRWKRRNTMMQGTLWTK